MPITSLLLNPYTMTRYVSGLSMTTSLISGVSTDIYNDESNGAIIIEKWMKWIIRNLFHPLPVKTSQSDLALLVPRIS